MIFVYVGQNKQTFFMFRIGLKVRINESNFEKV